MNAFAHRQASHCESGVMASLVTHAGLPLSEAMAFGLSSALSFAYLPFFKVGGFPLVAFRMPPGHIIRGLRSPLGLEARFETFRREEDGVRRLDALLDEGRLVGLRASVYWLPYFPEDLRFHFNAHNLLVYGREGGDYLISDPVFETPVSCPEADLTRARFAKGPLAPKGLVFHLPSPPREPRWEEALPRAIRRTCRIMASPIPIAGTWGMETLARRLERLEVASEGKWARHFIGHVVRMQEEIGTGGAGFRFLYAAFLQEAADRGNLPALRPLAQELMAIGDAWRELASEAALMVQGRSPLVPARLGGLLRGLAGREKTFFRALKRSV